MTSIKYKVLSFFILFIYTANCQSEIKRDSLVKVYNTQSDDTTKFKTIRALFDLYLNNDLNKAKAYALEELELSKKINYTKGIGLAQLHLGVIHDYKSELDSALLKYKVARGSFNKYKYFDLEAVAVRNIAGIEYGLGNYNKALDINKEGIAIMKTHLNDSIGLIPFYHNLGLIYNYKGDQEKALRFVLKELELLKNVNRPIPKADALNLLAQIEANRGNFNQAIDYNKEALVIYRSQNDKQFESIALNDIGLYNIYIENYTTAIDYLDKSLVISKELGNKSLEGTTLTNLGKSYFLLGKNNLALSYFNEALIILKAIGVKNKIAEALIELGNIYLDSGEVSKSISSYNEAITLSEQNGAKGTLALALEGRSNALIKNNNYKLAYENQLRYKVVSDSIYNIEKSKQIEQMRAVYDTETKEQQILQQETELSLFGEREKVNKLKTSLLGLGLVLSIISLGFAYFGFRQKSRRTKLEKEKLDAELAFKKKELTTHALHLAKKNELLEGLKQKAEQLRSNESSKGGYQELIRTINFDLQDDNNWENFSYYFEQVHRDFNKYATQKYPDLTPNELRLMSLVKMNLSIKEIANILNISIPGVKKARQRLRKKMNLTQKDSLEHAVLSIY